MSLTPRIDGDRLLGRLDAFARIGATPAGGVNRQAFSVEDRRARRLLAELALERGFTVFQDDIANLFIRREGTDATLPPFLIGSHLDSQPTGGRFDGALGTLSAFEVLEALEDSRAETRMPVEVVAWANEEGSRFAPGVMGSMAFTGADTAAWKSIVGADGALLAAELEATITALPEAALRPTGMPISGYVELHIEQGPSLEKEQLPIGVVTAVQGTRWLEVSIQGTAGHAGTTDLAYRRDPMVAAIAAIHRLQTTIMPLDSSARLTVGRIAARPGSINAIPQSVAFTVDIRHPRAEQLNVIEAEVRQVCAAEAEAQHCTAVIKRSFDMPGAAFSPDMVNTVEEAASSLQLQYKQMISGAFHDALFLARVAPAAMIFVPCRDGLSHNEAEYVEPGDAVIGAHVLLRTAIMAASPR
ncbi:Zn-dependent hydrolase [Mesorhizobium sp. WSM4310]|uniref:Zn-dependent hydrolase n=1 Tax=Mesorhizobium sp. WSM4310 TaxID=2589883 RepID=UPI00115E5134|nr:Zn-dependent hydrolase [Mesorhizobium sp. WSM4310]TRC91823.1 Zn-dependent hydrolase [Mesorhizobium sp. WSM4310]